jgi:hypothetical protein
MDNQHKQIKGYRDLSQEEIDLMNKIKALAEQVGELVKEVQNFEINLYKESKDFGVTYGFKYGSFEDNFTWTESAKKDLQLGFMQLTRAVAKPTTF